MAALVTTNWDALNPTKLSTFVARQEARRTQGIWHPFVSAGAASFQHYGITSTTDDEEADLQAARQNMRAIMSNFTAADPMNLQLGQQFHSDGEKEATANWLVNSMPALGRFHRQPVARSVSERGSLQQAEQPQGYSSQTKGAAVFGAVAAGAYAYHRRDDVKRGVNTGRDISRRMKWEVGPSVRGGNLGVSFGGSLM